MAELETFVAWLKDVLSDVQKIYDIIVKELEEIKDKYGDERRSKITGDADRQVVVIKAEAERDAQQVRGQGDAQAAEIYAGAYNKNPEFYAFYRSLQAYRDAFKNNGVIVLDPKSEFMRYFGESKLEGKQ